VLVGHSFGGAVVIAAGAVTPQVAGVVALAPRT
jgi:pimeloyl-ACP methyl ester carboxylesterase